MPIAPLMDMTHGEIEAYVEDLERQVKELTAKTDNRKLFSPMEVRMVRRLADDGRSNAEIAEIMDCNPATVSRIVRRIYYPDVA